VTNLPRVVGAVCLVLSVCFFIGQALTQAASEAPYSWIYNNISDLGSTTCGPISVFTYTAWTCSPWHVVMNATFVLVGLLTIVGMLATAGIWPRGSLATAGVALLVISGGGEVAAGLSPEDVRPMLHIIGAILGIGSGALGVMLLGLAVWHVDRWIGVSSVALGGLALFGFVIAPSLGLPPGAAERLAGYPTVIWEVAIGVVVLLPAITGTLRASSERKNHAK
jgi:hypothetical membrane protein